MIGASLLAIYIFHGNHLMSFLLYSLKNMVKDSLLLPQFCFHLCFSYYLESLAAWALVHYHHQEFLQVMAYWKSTYEQYFAFFRVLSAFFSS